MSCVIACDIWRQRVEVGWVQRLRAENVEGHRETRQVKDAGYSIDIPLVPQLARGRWYGLEQVEPLGKIDLKTRQVL